MNRVIVQCAPAMKYGLGAHSFVFLKKHVSVVRGFNASSLDGHVSVSYNV